MFELTIEQIQAELLQRALGSSECPLAAAERCGKIRISGNVVCFHCYTADRVIRRYSRAFINRAIPECLGAVIDNHAPEEKEEVTKDHLDPDKVLMSFLDILNHMELAIKSWNSENGKFELSDLDDYDLQALLAIKTIVEFEKESDIPKEGVEAYLNDLAQQKNEPAPAP